MSQIPDIQKTDLVAIIVDLLFKLPDSRENLQKLIFQSSFFNVVEITQLENIFKLVERQFKFNILLYPGGASPKSVQKQNSFQELPL